MNALIAVVGAVGMMVLTGFAGRFVWDMLLFSRGAYAAAIFHRAWPAFGCVSTFGTGGGAGGVDGPLRCDSKVCIWPL